MRRHLPLRALRVQDLLFTASLGALVLGGACDCGDDLSALPGTVVGNLCSVETGKPLAGHTVTVDATDGAREVTTDLFGQYEAKNVAAGPVIVSADVEGQERAWEITVKSGDTEQVNDEQCRPPAAPPPPPTGSVSGCVCDEDRGEWVEAANVFIVTPSGEPVVTGTDDVGCFDLAGVPVGQHLLKIEKGAFYTEHDVTVTADADFPIPTPASCEAPPPPPPPPESGTVSGRVCAPDGTTWLGGAIVSVETENGTVQTTTDENGYYTLEGAPAGEDVEVTITKGSFESTLIVDVPENGVVQIPEEECAIDQNVTIAVVDGVYDDVKSVLLNVGIEESAITEFTGAWGTNLLTDYATLSQYDIVLLNCGLSDSDFIADAGNAAIMRDNLRQFVEDGGSVYGSDWAYNVVEMTFPEYIDFYGDDASAHTAKKGYPSDSVIGSVVDVPLATALGTNQLELHYPLGAWVIMESVAPQVRVYIRGDAPWSNTGFFQGGSLSNVPHTVSFSSGEGKVVYTSFHQEPGINAEMERVLQLLVFEL